MSGTDDKRMSASISALQSKLGLIRSLIIRDAINDPKAIRAIEGFLYSAEGYIDSAMSVVKDGVVPTPNPSQEGNLKGGGHA